MTSIKNKAFKVWLISLIVLIIMYFIYDITENGIISTIFFLLSAYVLIFSLYLVTNFIFRKVDTSIGELSDTSKEAIGQFLILVAIISYLGPLIYKYFNKPPTPPTEVSGTVEYYDCRQKIVLNNDSYLKRGGTFVCLYGVCAQIETENGICTKAYIYEKQR